MKKRGSSLGRDLKKFDKVIGNNPQRMYQGQSPAAPDPAELKAMNKRSARIAEKLDVEMRIYLERYLIHKTHAAAWSSLYPDCKPESAGRQGWRMMERIRGVISEKEIHAMLGLSEEAIVSAVGRGLIAKAKKSFILPKTGEIRETESYDDTANQLVAASIGAKLTGMLKDDDAKQAVVVNIIDYSGGLPPWPGGGRGALPAGQPVLPTKTVEYKSDPADVQVGRED